MSATPVTCATGPNPLIRTRSPAPPLCSGACLDCLPRMPHKIRRHAHDYGHPRVYNHDALPFLKTSDHFTLARCLFLAAGKGGVLSCCFSLCRVKLFYCCYNLVSFDPMGRRVSGECQRVSHHPHGTQAIGFRVSGLDSRRRTPN